MGTEEITSSEIGENDSPIELHRLLLDEAKGYLRADLRDRVDVFTLGANEDSDQDHASSLELDPHGLTLTHDGRVTMYKVGIEEILAVDSDERGATQALTAEEEKALTETMSSFRHPTSVEFLL